MKFRAAHRALVGDQPRAHACRVDEARIALCSASETGWDVGFDPVARVCLDGFFAHWSFDEAQRAIAGAFPPQPNELELEAGADLIAAAFVDGCVEVSWMGSALSIHVRGDRILAVTTPHTLATEHPGLRADIGRIPTRFLAASHKKGEHEMVRWKVERADRIVLVTARVSDALSPHGIAALVEDLALEAAAQAIVEATRARDRDGLAAVVVAEV